MHVAQCSRRQNVESQRTLTRPGAACTRSQIWTDGPIDGGAVPVFPYQTLLLWQFLLYTRLRSIHLQVIVQFYLLYDFTIVILTYNVCYQLYPIPVLTLTRPLSTSAFSRDYGVQIGAKNAADVSMYNRVVDCFVFTCDT